MIKIKNITIRNFMSIGNATQAVAFDKHDLTLVVGENLDLGGNGLKNGVGKSSLLNAISYALYGQAISKIKRDNLINKTNAKNMLVSVDLDIDGKEYRIERGRKPNVLRFFIDNKEQETADNDAQGDNRQTQESIERFLGMSHLMFKHVVALSTYTDPFLTLPIADQRQIIEQLLGITQLSEKAIAAKEQIKLTKEKHFAEETRLKAVQDANKKIEEQIESLRRRSTMWERKRSEDIAALTESLTALSHIDIDEEIKAHGLVAEYDTCVALSKALESEITRLKKDIAKHNADIKKLTKEVDDLVAHTCYACGQAFHDDNHETVLAAKKTSLMEGAASLVELSATLEQKQEELAKNTESAPKKPTLFYQSFQDALNHRNSVEVLARDLQKKMDDINPYVDQISEMEDSTKDTVNYDELNKMSRLLDHQEFLLRLLVNKDSFIRKKIIDQNLAYLNARLTQYIDKLGLPHDVVFQNDLSVLITDLGRELDFDNLSRGERGRLTIALSFAFKDVWETLYPAFNMLFLDEVLDNGLDPAGVETAMGLLKKMARDNNRSVWLVSHREELESRCANIMKVVKEHGFTTFTAT